MGDSVLFFFTLAFFLAWLLVGSVCVSLVLFARRGKNNGGKMMMVGWLVANKKAMLRGPVRTCVSTTSKTRGFRLRHTHQLHVRIVGSMGPNELFHVKQD